MEMICAIIYQLTKNLSPEEIERSGFAPYYVDHTLALWPQAASGAPWTATYFQSKGDPITDLHEDLQQSKKRGLRMIISCGWLKILKSVIQSVF